VEFGDGAAGLGDLFERLFAGGLRWQTAAPGAGDSDEIVEENDGFFRRRGLDVHCDVPVSISQAALGARLRVRAYASGGRAELRVPAGTQPGTTFRLRGLGAGSGERRGDQFVTIRVVIPRALTPRQKELFEELEAETRATRPR
jgi:molecular chaperone DnaJ